MEAYKKENIQYMTSIFFLLTGIIMAFWSFFDSHDVATGVLTYLGEAVALVAGVFSINLYVKNRVSEVEVRLNEKINTRMKKVDELIQD